jgi:hypothetical protein
MNCIPDGAAYTAAVALLARSLAPLIRAVAYHRALGCLIPSERHMADHASIAAATAAGYKEIVLDRGVSYGATRFEVTLEPIVGEPGALGTMFRAFGQGSTQAAAEAVALAALNEQRAHRYGCAGGNEDIYGGNLTIDTH